MQEFARDSEKEAILGGIKKGFYDHFGFQPLVECREGRRSETSSLRPSRLSLDDKHQHLLWGCFSDRFHLAHTVGTQRIEAYAVLLRYQMLC